ncbi:MAG: hypothetical protein REH79_00050 [Spiroplasma sp.]|nr:hypothetical protein [Spiroplasma sp.]
MPKIDEPALLNAKLPSKKTYKILLKNRKRQALIWTGIKEVDDEASAEPVVLEFKNEILYFYWQNIHVTKNNWQTFRFNKELTSQQQEKLISGYDQNFDKNNLVQHGIILKLKVDFLSTKNKEFDQNLNERNILSQSEFDLLAQENLNQRHKIEVLSTKQYSLNRKLGSYCDGFEIKATELKNVEKLSDYFQEIIVDCHQEFDVLLNDSNKLFKKIERFPLPEKKDLQTLPEQELLVPKYSKKVIVLKYKKNQAFVWWGANQKEPNLNEKLLVLQFDKQDFYFYPSRIGKENHSLNLHWVFFKSSLTSQQQAQIFESFIKIVDPKNLYCQNVILKLKLDILQTEFNALGLNKLNKNQEFLSAELFQFTNKLTQMIKNHRSLNREIENNGFSHLNSDYQISENLSQENLFLKNVKVKIDQENEKIELLKQELFSLSQRFKTVSKDLLLSSNLEPLTSDFNLTHFNDQNQPGPSTSETTSNQAEVHDDEESGKFLGINFLPFLDLENDEWEQFDLDYEN